MLKRDITYTDFNDNEVTEPFYFNLSKAELVEMEMMTEGGMAKSLQDIVKAQNSGQLIATFKKIILESYGVKSEDGKRFIKSEELRHEFSQTAAFQQLFVELCTNDEAAAIFINGIMPKDMTIAVDKAQTDQIMQQLRDGTSGPKLLPLPPTDPMQPLH